MIRYNLRCEKGHAFESWFQSSAAYETQEKRKLVSCPSCGSVKVERAIMAPQIVTKKGREQAAPAPAVSAETAGSESTPLLMAQELELRTKLKELRDHIVKNADNVGERFPNEARKMHYGDIEHRPIYGEASPDEARALIDEGVEVSPLPVLPDDRNSPFCEVPLGGQSEACPLFYGNGPWLKWWARRCAPLPTLRHRLRRHQ
jgi:hypothetical protein